ncbi:uncharacterized protein AMSG_11046 [Thecamonas trahens ATCC 50062]|uniref:Uncharacterized protein n=1 Tax=Thecamonas trahens ATCC 50062 TaxID=461836 RepID=A0A0L0DV27_THETB|nr:hypothetical protein AMSG_11046 [Thecamonas trahens ATCC 50062]KNC55388.1 hypothetical protein AMSG_11046 [Thecamonas trahens ATCC 50062]|eukprot:XP_013753020.1 hypothetical protein AMSG_11046 [Thecamonas trahens ATCC 50062]
MTPAPAPPRPICRKKRRRRRRRPKQRHPPQARVGVSRAPPGVLMPGGKTRSGAARTGGVPDVLTPQTRSDVPTTAISGGAAPTEDAHRRRIESTPQGDARSSAHASRWRTSGRERVELTGRATLVLAVPFICYLGWLVPIFVIGFSSVENTCDRPLVGFVFGFILIMGAFMVFYVGVIAYAWRHVNPNSRTTRVLDRAWEFLEKTIIVVTIAYCSLGAYWIDTTRNCKRLLPNVYWLALSIVVTFLFIPLSYIAARICYRVTSRI